MIVYNVASYKRADTLVKTVNSILPQCDVINVTLNCYDAIPVGLYNNKIRIFMANNEKGDAYKFSELCTTDGYFFTIDDDILYPPNYTEYMIKRVEKRGREDIITLHGRNYESFPIESFCNSKCAVYHFNEFCGTDVKVHVGGTGVMCFHTDLMRIPIDYFQLPNMADLWVAKYAKEHDINIVCVAHPSEYVNIQSITTTSIFEECKKNDSVQTKLINNIYRT